MEVYTLHGYMHAEAASAYLVLAVSYNSKLFIILAAGVNVIKLSIFLTDTLVE